MGITTFFNSFIFWGAWVIIPFIMEIIPSIGSAITLIKKRIRNHHPKPPVAYPEISLIVPVYNSYDSLRECIKSIHDSSYDDSKIRVYLVNNRTKDDSFHVYTEAQKEFPTVRMQWLNARQGKSRALNLALYNSTGKYIINIDSDGALEKDALKNMIDVFESDSSIGCMTGAILTIPEQIEEYKHFFSRLLRQIEFVEYAQAFLAGRSYASEKNEIYTLSGAFSAFRKSTVLKSRMYNTNTIAEDTQITFQMRYLMGQKVKLCDNAIYFVGPIEGMNKLYTQRQRWQRGSLEVANMFDSKDFRPIKMLKDVNVRTLLYDHTFAFPRIVWILALVCLYFMDFSTKMILLSSGLIMLIYVVIAYLYFWSISIFLKEFPDIRKYYKSLWWAIPILPLFNMLTFFIRLTGIFNSMNTTSAWKTKTFTEEVEEYKSVVKSDMKKISLLNSKLYHFMNES
ncbi:MAG: putative glycosyltransferase, exosortase G system-associated [Butyrivibrio sp.]|nr:TIGR03111 family XrtG-associated glycosyltransferase [Butyrivibrio sp.]MBR1642555.1 putative glycosyltransferase, exosortase G system-associated [Butyrivibrio sp.]